MLRKKCARRVRNRCNFKTKLKCWNESTLNLLFFLQKYTRDLAQSLFLYKSDGRTDVCVCVNMLVCRCLGTFKMNSKFINIFCCCSNRINIFFFHLIQKQYTNTTMHVNCWDWCGCGGVEAYYMQAGSVGHRKPYANAIFWFRPIPFTFRLFTYQMNVCLCFFSATVPTRPKGRYDACWTMCYTNT